LTKEEHHGVSSSFAFNVVRWWYSTMRLLCFAPAISACPFSFCAICIQLYSVGCSTFGVFSCFEILPDHVFKANNKFFIIKSPSYRVKCRMYEFMDKRLRHRVRSTGLSFDCASNPDRVCVYVAFAVQVLYFARRGHYNN
jgi:hypothetical protein